MYLILDEFIEPEVLAKGNCMSDEGNRMYRLWLSVILHQCLPIPPPLGKAEEKARPMIGHDRCQFPVCKCCLFALPFVLFSCSDMSIELELQTDTSICREPNLAKGFTVGGGGGVNV